MGYGKISKDEAKRRALLAEQGLKVCSRCKEEKPFDQFTKETGKKDGYRCICKSCAQLQTEERKAYFKKYREENRDAMRERCHAYYVRNKDKRIAYNRQNKERFDRARKLNDHKPANRYKLYIHNAEVRGIPFELTLDEFDELTRQPCCYCGCLPDDGFGSQFTGLDRIDSSNGYFVGNVVPCCNWCNKMKLDYTPLEWMAQIKKIYENLKMGE